MASTAVIEMLTVSPCRKMTVFGMESSPPESDNENENEVDTVPFETGKRSLCPLSEADEDREKGQVKKRRKQSKPVRIASSSSEKEDVESKSELRLGSLPPFSEIPSVIKEDSAAAIINGASNSSSSSSSSSGSSSSSRSSSSSTSSLLSEDYGGSKCRPEERMMTPDRAEKVSSSGLLPINLSSVKSLDGSIECQQQQQGKQHKQEQEEQEPGEGAMLPILSYQENPEGIRYNKTDNMFIATSSSPLSFVPQMKHVTTANSGSPGLRIFNPEAFCDLCNKEFCNKYFLKTHKANKHGIYIDNIGPSVIDALPPLPFINYFSSTNEALVPSGATTVPTTAPGCVTHLTTRSPLKKPQAPFPQQQNPATAFLLKNSGNNSTRAFCNVCRREFCNKYFVRRHKAKIHGIIEPGYSDNSMDFDQKFQEKYEDQDQSGKIDPDMQRTTFPRIKQDADEETEESSKNSGRNSPDPSSQLRSTGIPFGPLMLDGEKDLSNEKLKKMGVVNSEAFCDICCKEYCNKYFLRTHKMKSHGIIPTDLDKKEERMMMLMMNAAESLPQGVYNNQAMPLNLIVADNDKSDKNYINRDVGVANEKDRGLTCTCNICGRGFKTLFLLEMHNSYVHADEKELQEKGFQKQDRAIGELQKVHSNVAVVPKANNSSNDTGFCEICHRDFNHPSYLESHIVNEHSNLLEEIERAEDENPDIPKECNFCQKSFPNYTSLEQHLVECHSSVDQTSFVNPKSVSGSGHKDTHNHNHNHTHSQPPCVQYPQSEIQTAPTSSFCEICKKELCNKYFMKTHMQRMHGISIENGAHIGGVVCDICNKELCSKYFLRVHKQNSHGIVDEVLGFDMSRNQSPNADSSNLRPSTEQNDPNNRYFSHFTEVCAVCSRRFRSMKWLKAHLLNDHGDEGKEKWREFQSHFEFRQSKETAPIKKPEGGASRNPNNSNSNETFKTDTDFKGNSTIFSTIFNGKNTTAKQYRCSYCNFSTSILAFLFVHERSHIGTSGLLLENKTFLCRICNGTFETSESYEKHRLTHNENNITAALQQEEAEQEGEKEEHDTVKGHIITNNIDAKQQLTNHSQSINQSQSQQQFTPESVAEDKRRLDKDKERINGALIQVKESLDLIANKTEIPVSFSVPHTLSQSQVIMQPFVLEDSGQLISPSPTSSSSYSTSSSTSNNRKSFLSSIVFLPVKERLKTPVMASFKLTPT